MQFRIVLAAAALVAIVPVLTAQPIDWHSAESVASAAIGRHPSLVRLEAQMSAARERVDLAGSYPNPMIMGGVQNRQIDLSNDEMTMNMVGASQTIPRKSRREALTRSAELDVRRLEIEAGSLREEIRRDALFVYFDLAAAGYVTNDNDKVMTWIAFGTGRSARSHSSRGCVTESSLTSLCRTNFETEALHA